MINPYDRIKYTYAMHVVVVHPITIFIQLLTNKIYKELKNILKIFI